MVAAALATGVWVTLLPAYVTSQVSEVLVTTYLLSYHKEKEKKGGVEADVEREMRVSCLLSCFLLRRSIISFGV